MKYKGYVGRYALIDLTRQSIHIEPLDEGLARNYIGGSGFAARILYDMLLSLIHI